MSEAEGSSPHSFRGVISFKVPPTVHSQSSPNHPAVDIPPKSLKIQQFSTPAKEARQSVPGTSRFNATPRPTAASLSSHTTPSHGGNGRGANRESEVPWPKRPPQEKLNAVLNFIKDELDWTLGGFLWELFRRKDDDGKDLKRSDRHARMLSRFLRGGNQTCWMSKLLHEILGHRLGRLTDGSSAMDDMWSTSKKAIDITSARGGITTFALELVQQQFSAEVRMLSSGSSGLHGSLQGAQQGSRRQIAWNDIGPSTHGVVQDICQSNAPLLFHTLVQLASPKHHRKGMHLPELAVTEAISDILFSSSSYVRLLPTARAILLFACGAQQTVFKYTSRTAYTPSWKTTIAQLKRLAQLDAEYIQAMMWDWLRSGLVRIDNVQQYVRRQDSRVARGSYMKVGLAGYIAEAVDWDPRAADLDAKLAELAKNLRAEITVEKLLGLIDLDHYDIIMMLQWLEALINNVPELALYKGELEKLHHTDGAKGPIPSRKPTPIYPLSCNSKNENVTSDMRDAILDFLKQLGQRDGNYMQRVHWIGGDGLTFERLLQIKSAMAGQGDEFRDMTIIQPFLETWHTGWTQLSLVFESHWVSALSKDPSSLGHSASLIKQRAPSNLKKVDYYPAMFTAYTVLDARMLDCWRLHLGVDDLFLHFQHIVAQKKPIPTFAALKDHALQLHQCYTSRRTCKNIMLGRISNNRGVNIPTGSPWVPRETNETSSKMPTSGIAGPAEKKSSKKDDKVSPEHFKGDHVMGRSTMFMIDCALSRNFTGSSARGLPGNVWQAMIMMLFCFAGSDHGRYSFYILEMIAWLEYEATPIEREVFLKNLLVNPSGKAGKYLGGDLLLEKQNRELEFFVEHKDSSFDSDYVRHIIAPNLMRFSTLKNTFCDGLGLAKRRMEHTEPTNKAEIRILMEAYKREELHVFREGRTYDSNNEPTDTFSLGVTALRKTKLKKWIAETMRGRRVQARRTAAATSTDGDTPSAAARTQDAAHDEVPDPNDDEDEEEILEEMEDSGTTDGRAEVIDGSVVVNVGSDWGIDGNMGEESEVVGDDEFDLLAMLASQPYEPSDDEGSEHDGDDIYGLGVGEEGDD